MGAITHQGEVLQRLPANASQINFDNDGTDLSATQTDNAIKEVNTKANTLQSEKADTDIVASDFSTSASYTAGDYCIYEGKFYKFKNNHSGAWSAADVDEIKIAGELSALKSGLTNGLVFDPFEEQPPSNNPFNTGGSGYVIQIKYHGILLGYLVIHPNGYATEDGVHKAFELYNTSWEPMWDVLYRVTS